MVKVAYVLYPEFTVLDVVGRPRLSRRPDAGVSFR